MEQLKHFRHEHLLNLVQLQPHHNNENSDDENEDEDEDKDDIVVEEVHVGNCDMCNEEIYSFHLCYYSCRDCEYSLHKFCAQLPETIENHPLHPGHTLIFPLSNPYMGDCICSICKIEQKWFYNYHCYICEFDIDIVCATMSDHKMNHPSHPHQLQRYFGKMISRCIACGNTHSGTFYHCTTCSWFRIHLDCVLLPAKLLIQQFTNESFSHSHLLKLVYSYPLIEQNAKFLPRCRVCDERFYDTDLWHYRCDKCRYYVHVDCATSRKEAFMSSILMRAGMGKTYKNFKDEDHPNLINFPFPDENVNLLTSRFINKGELVITNKIDGGMFSHPHPLNLVDTLLNESVSLHDPMKKVELLCDGCVRPVTDVPFYKCSQHHCGFVLHEWCTRLPSEVQHHSDHPVHTLVLQPKPPGNLFGVFSCDICELPCNGFAYKCEHCEYFVDVHCAFKPNVITHEAHPNHLLLRFEGSGSSKCKACQRYLSEGFHCPTCDLYLHIECALLLPKTIRHKYDRHPLSLRYYPAENHSSEYFCEICEDEFNPSKWFYHCSMCAFSMHTTCAPLKLQCEQNTFAYSNHHVFWYLNVKFGGIHEIRIHPHPLTFVQGIAADGQCIACDYQLQYQMIFKCIQCKFALHCYPCAEDLIISEASDAL